MEGGGGVGGGEELEGGEECEGRGLYVVRRGLVCDVNYLRARVDGEQRALQRADEVVRRSEIREQRDDHGKQ